CLRQEHQPITLYPTSVMGENRDGNGRQPAGATPRAEGLIDGGNIFLAGFRVRRTLCIRPKSPRTDPHRCRKEQPMPEPMQHPPAQDLAAFSQGKLSQVEADAVARHLKTCSSCQAAAQKAADSFLGKVRDARPAPSGTCLPPGPKRPDGPSLL